MELGYASQIFICGKEEQKDWMHVVFMLAFSHTCVFKPLAEQQFLK